MLSGVKTIFRITKPPSGMSNPNPVHPSAPSWFAGFALVALLGYGVFLGINFAPVAGGSDSSGYLNAARLLADGRLTTPQRDLSGLVVSTRLQLQPLGFTSEPALSRLVPTYPLGLPAHIAIASVIFGWNFGPLLVGVGAALAAIVLCYAVGRELGLSRAPAATGAVLFGAFPVTLFISIQPLSDVLAATWVLAAVFFALRGRLSPLWSLGAGAAFAVAVFVRPTNILLLPVLAVLLPGWRALFAAAAGGLPGAILLLATNAHLHGSPWRMGYGSIFDSFAAVYFWPTLGHFALWLGLLLPAVILALPFATLWRSQIAPRIAVALGLWFAIPVVFYAFYEVSHEVWWCLRFILPATPPLIFAALLGLQGILASRPRALVAASVGIALWGAGASLHWTRHFHILLTETYEEAYADIGRWARDQLPPEAVLLCYAESGAIHYYTPLPILRWEQIGPEEFARHAAHLTGAGRPIYLLLFPADEESVFRDRLPGRWGKKATVSGRNFWRYFGPSTP